LKSTTGAVALTRKYRGTVRDKGIKVILRDSSLEGLKGIIKGDANSQDEPCSTDDCVIDVAGWTHRLTRCGRGKWGERLLCLNQSQPLPQYSPS